MKKPSVTIYLRPNKAKDRAAVNARYIYNRENLPIPLGFSINISDWDAKRQRVEFGVAGSAEANGKIKEATAALESIANALIQAGKVPTVEVVKAAYTEHVEGKHRERLKANFKLARELKIYSHDGTQEEYEKALKLLAHAEASINRLRPTVERIQNSVEGNQEFSQFLNEHPRAGFGITPEDRLRFSSLAGLVNPPAKAVHGGNDNPAKKQFLELLQEYMEERTGVGLDASKEEVKAVKRATSGTNKGLRSWAKTLRDFVNSKQVRRANLQVSIANMSQKFYDTYAAYLMNPEGHNLYNNSFGGHVKKLKTFLKWIELDKQLVVDRRYLRFKVLTEVKEIIALGLDDINLLYEYEPEPEQGRKHKDANSWRKYIDFTVFSFLTSLRISDIKRVKGVRVVNGYLQGRTVKTNGNFKIPLSIDPRITEILERYGGDMNLFSDVEYNRQVKKLLKMFLEKYGLHQQPLTLRRFKHTEPEPIETTHYFHELYTSHCNRRGWVSFMSDRGFDDFTLMEMMGTKSHQEFLKYKRNKVTHLDDKVRQVLGTV